MKSLFIFACVLVFSTTARKLPSFIRPCKLKDGDISKCILQTINMLKPKFGEGIPELLIPSFNPFIIPSAAAKFGENFDGSLKNLEIYLPHSFSIDEFHADLDILKIDLKLSIPEIYAEANYKINGKLLSFKLDGGGLLKLNLYKFVAKVVAHGKREEKHGKIYLRPTNIDIKPDFESMKIHLDNLFESNPQLTDQANLIINENQKVLVEDFSPVIVDVVKGIVKKHIDNFFASYSLDTLFPDE